METLLCIYGLWLCTLGPGGETATTVDLTSLVQNVQPAVVTIYAYNKDRKLISQGSGFFISDNGHVATCYHVLEGAYSAEAKTFTGRTCPVKTILAINKKADLIKVSVDIGEGLVKPVKLEGNMPAIAERVVVIGSPLGLEQTVSEGIVSGIRANSVRGRSFQMSASISKGSSGSPVINMRGRIIGLASSQLVEGQNLNFAISSEHVLALASARDGTGLSDWNSGVVDEAKSANLLKKGREYVAVGKFEQALTCFECIGSSSAHFKHAMMLLGMCYSKLGHEAEAIVAYRRAVEASTDDIEAHLCLGLAYSSLGNYRKAAEIYQRAVQIDPERADVRLCLGMAFSQVGEHQRSIEAYEGAIRIDPQYADAYCGIGVSQYRLGDCRAAATAYEQAIHHNPAYARARFGLGLSFAALGNKDMALEQYGLLKTQEKDLAAKLLVAVGK